MNMLPVYPAFKEGMSSFHARCECRGVLHAVSVSSQQECAGGLGSPIMLRRRWPDATQTKFANAPLMQGLLFLEHVCPVIYAVGKCFSRAQSGYLTMCQVLDSDRRAFFFELRWSLISTSSALNHL